MELLATLLRPQNLAEFIGQTHLVGPDKPLRKAIEQELIFSMIFWGPPGVGKTTLARILAKQTHHQFFELSAVSAGKSDIRAIIEESQTLLAQRADGKAPVLFLDEIHRFNKAQQDYLLPYVENGQLILIGATTENPSFEVISALLSRSRVFVLEPLTPEDLNLLLDKVISHIFTTTKKTIGLDEETRTWLIKYANGDARKLLTLVDNSWGLYQTLNLNSLKSSLENQSIRYDKDGEEHYDTISAFIKSMRASDVNAALYYLARMVEGGEDPKFIARRMVIFASEDVGLAAPTALVVANAVFDAVHKIGYPEAQINLAHGTAYLAQCAKSRSAYDGYFAALADVKKHGNLPIPMQLRNAPTKLMKELGYGKQDSSTTNQSLLPNKLKNKHYLD